MSMNFSASKQFVRPPQRGIFPLDHDSECKVQMKVYLTCLKDAKQQHHKCRDFSKAYLQCRMDKELMANEDLDQMGYSNDAKVESVSEYDKMREKNGYIAGKHIEKPTKWWFER
mmetsp:Transcript_14881/g.18149  ORF Transcript_14881/g.18149 Transcript_14881/m.18149 type:complete len:114 (+) Transcript_14881:77-418(+)